MKVTRAQQDALRDAGEFVLAYILDRIPNEDNPKAWKSDRVNNLQNAVVTLGGDFTEAAE